MTNIGIPGVGLVAEQPGGGLFILAQLGPCCEFRRNPARDFRFDVGHRSDLIPATIPK